MTTNPDRRAFNWKATLVIFAVSFSTLLVMNYSLPFFFGGNRNPEELTTITVANVTITVDYKNGTIDQRTNVTSRIVNATVFDIMNKEFHIAYDVYPAGYFISEINGARLGWTYMVDSVSPGIACNKYQVSNNSIITWHQA